MAETRTVELRASGIFVSPSKLRLPPGAARVAENVMIDAEDIWSRRRGFERFGDELDAPAKAISSYMSRIVLLDGTSVKYDASGSGTWTAYTGSFSPPNASTRMSFLESNKNLYFLTSLGPYVVDVLNGTPIRAGTPAGLDMSLSQVGTGGSWNLADSTVGYTHTWTHTDANTNAKQGSPAFQERFANAFTTDLAWTRSTTTATVAHTAHGFLSGDLIHVEDSSDPSAITNGTKTITVIDVDTYTFPCLNAGASSGTLSDGKDGDLQVTFRVPEEVQVGDTWDLWRTNLANGAGEPVGGDYRLIMSGQLTTAQKAAGEVVVTDDNPDDFLGEPLYTNAGEETDQQKNDRPPFARFVAQYQGHTFYADCVEPHQLAIQLSDLSNITDETSSLTFTSGSSVLTYTFSATENQGARKFLHSASLSTLAANIEATAKSLVRIVNGDSGNDQFVAFYVSAEDDAPGKLLFEKRTVNTDGYTLTANSTNTGNNFTPVVPTSGTTLSSDNSAKPNGVYRSKHNQPEAVPRLNFHLFGKANKRIRGAQGLKEALEVWKEDGLFVLNGQTDSKSGANFVTDELDPTAILSAENSLTLLSNAALGWTLQGVLQAGQGDPAVISTPQVKRELLQISKYDNFESLAHAVGYESEQKYIFWVPETRASDVADIAYVFNKSTSHPSWTTLRKSVACAYVLPGGSADQNDRLFCAHAIDPYILKERKDLETSGNDYIDEEIPATITAVGTTTHPTLGTTVSQITLTYTYSAPLVLGFLLTQGGKRSKIDVVTSLGSNSYQVTLRNRYTFTTGAATIGLSVPFILEWAPVTLGDGASMKQFSVCTVMPDKAGGTFRLGFQTDLQQQREFINTIIQPKSKGWGTSPWGTVPWGDSTPGRVDAIRTWIPRNHQQGRALSVRLENHYAKEPCDILQLSFDLRPFSTRSQRTP